MSGGGCSAPKRVSVATKSVDFAGTWGTGYLRSIARPFDHVHVLCSRLLADIDAANTCVLRIIPFIPPRRQGRGMGCPPLSRPWGIVRARPLRAPLGRRTIVPVPHDRPPSKWANRRSGWICHESTWHHLSPKHHFCPIKTVHRRNEPDSTRGVTHHINCSPLWNDSRELRSALQVHSAKHPLCEERRMPTKRGHFQRRWFHCPPAMRIPERINPWVHHFVAVRSSPLSALTHWSVHHTPRHNTTETRRCTNFLLFFVSFPSEFPKFGVFGVPKKVQRWPNVGNSVPKRGS